MLRLKASFASRRQTVEGACLLGRALDFGVRARPPTHLCLQGLATGPTEQKQWNTLNYTDQDLLPTWPHITNSQQYNPVKGLSQTQWCSWISGRHVEEVCAYRLIYFNPVVGGNLPQHRGWLSPCLCRSPSVSFAPSAVIFQYGKRNCFLRFDSSPLWQHTRSELAAVASSGYSCLLPGYSFTVALLTSVRWRRSAADQSNEQDGSATPRSGRGIGRAVTVTLWYVEALCVRRRLWKVCPTCTATNDVHRSNVDS